MPNWSAPLGTSSFPPGAHDYDPKRHDLIKGVKKWTNLQRDPWSRHRPIGKCPLYRFGTTGQLLHSEVGSNQVGCSCTRQISLSRATNIGTPEEISAPYHSWRGCNHQNSNWPYKGHQIQYLVLRTTDCLSPLWPNTDHWAYAPRMCSVTGMSWWILHSWLIECTFRDNSLDLNSGIPATSRILLIWCYLSTSTSPETWAIW